MERTTVVFNLDWRAVLQDYPAEIRLEIYDAILEYASTGVIPELSALSLMAFKFIQKDIDKNNAKFDKKIEDRKKAGSKGGLKKAENQKDIAKGSKNNFATKNKQKLANVANVAENEILDENENENEIKATDVAENNKEKNISLEIKKEISFSDKFSLFKSEALRPNNPWGEVVKKNNCILNLEKVLDQFHDWLIETGGEEKFIANNLSDNKGWFKNALDRFYNPRSQITIGPTEYLRDGKRYFKHYADEFEAPLSMPPRPGVDYVLDKERPGRWLYVGY